MKYLAILAFLLLSLYSSAQINLEDLNRLTKIEHSNQVTLLKSKGYEFVKSENDTKKETVTFMRNKKGGLSYYFLYIIKDLVKKDAFYIFGDIDTLSYTKLVDNAVKTGYKFLGNTNSDETKNYQGLNAFLVKDRVSSLLMQRGKERLSIDFHTEISLFPIINLPSGGKSNNLIVDFSYNFFYSLNL